MAKTRVRLSKEQQAELRALIGELEAALRSEGPIVLPCPIPPHVTANVCLMPARSVKPQRAKTLNAAQRSELADAIAGLHDLLNKSRAGKEVMLMRPPRVSGPGC